MTTFYSLNKINKLCVYSNGVDIASCLPSSLFLLYNRMLTYFMYVLLSHMVYGALGKYDCKLNSKDDSDWTKRNPTSLANDQLKNKFVIQCCTIDQVFWNLLAKFFFGLKSLQTSTIPPAKNKEGVMKFWLSFQSLIFHWVKQP